MHETFLRAATSHFVALRASEGTGDADVMLAKLGVGDFKLGRGGTDEAIASLAAKPNVGGVTPLIGADSSDGASRGTPLTVELVQLDVTVRDGLVRRRFFSLCATRARFGLLLLCGSAHELALLTQSSSQLDDVADVPDGRLFALLDGYIVAIDRRGLRLPYPLSASKVDDSAGRPTQLFSDSDLGVRADDAIAVWTVEHGIGSCVWLARGHYYTGQFADDMANGHGTFVWSSGTVYTGEFRDELLHGHGKKVWVHGESYEGEWDGDLMHGHGTFHFANGDVYTGAMQNGLRCGPGTLAHWGDGCEYVGNFEAGEQHGFGTLTYARGDERGYGSYTGAWVCGKKHGHGAFTWQDGSEYVGEYLNDVRHGRGAMKYATGPNRDTVLEGEWREDKYVAE